MAFTTNTDSWARNEWLGDDSPIRLREWSSATRTWSLPCIGSASPPSLTIGTLESNWLRLDDPGVSREHAQLTVLDGRWVISDLKSKNGLWQDGERRLSFPLTPGVEIGIGGVTLIVESERLLALHKMLARLIGFGPERCGDVDRALRVVRMTATRRGSLLLCGEGDLTLIAQLLHRKALGDDRPFIVCDTRRRQTDSNARSAANYRAGIAALEAAAGGTMCVWKDRQPDDFAEVLAAIHDPSSRAQLVLCTRVIDPNDLLLMPPIVLPPLSERSSEVDAVIEAFGADAEKQFAGVFTSADHAWVRVEESKTLAKIVIATQRLVAYRTCGRSVTRAAKLLGMAHASFSEWLARRTLPA